jgi:hypothetical protein
MAKKKPPESIDSALDRLQAALKKAKNPDYKELAFTPVKKTELAKAEKALGTKLPPAYVDLITRRGVFCISDGDGGEYNPLLTPAEIAETTINGREACAEADPELGEAVADLIFFQGNLYRDNFYAFVVSSKNKDGEMAIDEFYHDDHYEPGSAKGDFRSHIVELVDGWISQLDE